MTKPLRRGESLKVFCPAADKSKMLMTLGEIGEAYAEATSKGLSLKSADRKPWPPFPSPSRSCCCSQRGLSRKSFE